MTWTYNRLNGKAREWARRNRIPTGERCVPVKGGRKMGKSAITKVAGDGSYGFSTRRDKKDGETTKMVMGLDGQWKAWRGTSVRRRKNVCRMATKGQIKKMEMDDYDRLESLTKEAIIHQVKLEKERAIRRELRKRNRNPRARRNHNKRKVA